MKVLVCGGRDFNDYDLVYRTMGEIDHNHWNGAVHISEIVQGGAKGADALAERWAEEMGVPVIAFHADWKSGGRAAGPIRNSKMLEYGPDLVVAFPGGRGTADMVGKAKRKGVEVIEVTAQQR